MADAKLKKLSHFSSIYKNQSINLLKNNTRARGIYGLAVVEGAVFEKGSSIRFLIEQIGGGVAVGFGIRNVIAGNGYEIKNWKETGHGCWVISNGGWSYCHSPKQQNSVKTDLIYSVGDVIEIKRNGDELLWMNERTKKKLKIKANLSADEWSQTCFCVNIDNESAVSIEI